MEIENSIQAGAGAEGGRKPGEEVTDNSVIRANGVVEAGGIDEDVVAAAVAKLILLDFRGFFKV